jgi:hypothetical protein
LKDKLKQETDSIVSSLQDLYEVGAISATEYESRSKSAMDAYRSVADDQYKLIKQYLPAVMGTEGIPALTTAIGLVQGEIAKMENDPNYTTNFVTLNNSIQTVNETLGTQFTNAITAINGLKTATGGKEPADYGYTPQQIADATAALGNQGTPIYFEDGSGATSRKFAVGTPSVPYDMDATVHKGEMIVPRTFSDAIRSGEVSLSANKGSSSSSGGDVYVTVNVSGSVQAENDLAATITQTINRQRRLGVLTV